MRTTEPFHYEGVSALWRRVAQRKTPKGRDAIYKGHYEGWFCASCAAYNLKKSMRRQSGERGDRSYLSRTLDTVGSRG